MRETKGVHGARSVTWDAVTPAFRVAICAKDVPSAPVGSRIPEPTLEPVASEWAICANAVAVNDSFGALRSEEVELSLISHVTTTPAARCWGARS